MEKYISDSLQSTDHNTEVLDIVGIGFGPSNIAIAIALQENAADLSAIFLERRPSFSWHETMLFDTAMMQVNFLKDLASFRNPRSHFTFVNFLHYQKRLADFTNLQTLFPRRTEFRQYLSWCAHHFDDIVRYSTSATSIETVLHDGVELFRIIAEGPDGSESILARNVVYSGGIEPRIPFPVVGERRVSHGYNILKEIDNHTPGSHYAVVGAGQSAAEITEFIYQRGARVTAIISRFGYMPADDSPFVNEIFDPAYTDVVFGQAPEEREAFLQANAQTNYSVVNLDLIESIYHRLYQQKVTGHAPHSLLPQRSIEAVQAGADGVRLTLQGPEGREDRLFDAVVLATGYRRDGYKRLLGGLQAHLGEGVERDYRLCCQPQMSAGIYLQGCCEASHGLSDTLLSVLAIRSQEVVDALLDNSRRRQSTGVASACA